MIGKRIGVGWLAIGATIGLFARLASPALADPEIVSAARTGDWFRVESLIEGAPAPADVNAVGADGTTALYWASRADHVEMARRLIESGARASVSDRYGITPLMLAATNGSAPMTELLLGAGADANEALPEGESVLMTAARTGRVETLRLLVEAGADVNHAEDTMGETALMWAAAENHPDAVRVLIELGADPDMKSRELDFPEFRFLTSGMVTTTLPRGGWTALMHAARQNAIEGARALARSGADLDLTDPDGACALVIAIINAHFDLAAMLLGEGADANVADANGMAALYATVDMHTLGAMFSRPPPRLVDDLSSVDLVRLLLDHGADADAQLVKPIYGRHHNAGDASLGEGSTPLMRAARSADFEILRLLLGSGADPTLTQSDYTTALMILVNGVNASNEAEIVDIVEEFLDAGVDAAAFNSNGQTALHSAVSRGANDLVGLLAAHGAKLDLRDRQGRTPLDIATGRGGRGGRGARGGGRGGPRGGGREETAELLRGLLAEQGLPVQ